LRNKTERLSYLLDWRQLGRFYYKARKLAAQKVFHTELPTSNIFTKGEFEVTPDDDANNDAAYDSDE